MTRNPGRPTRVLAVMDESDTQIALRSAAELADAHGATLEAFACVEPPHDLELVARLSEQKPEALIGSAAERLRDMMQARIVERLPGRSIELHVAVGKAFVEIVRHVAEHDCDFVVKKAEPLSGVNRFLFASTDQHLLRKCPCPVWLQTPSAPTAPRTILAAVDLDIEDAAEPETLDDLNRRVLDAAVGLASGPGAEVVVVHAWEAIGEGMVWAFSTGRDARLIADRYVNEIMTARRQAMEVFIESYVKDRAPSVRIVPRLARGTAERVIEEQSRQLGADVVVMGTVARTGFGGVFIGNTAENIINSLVCPVLAVKPEGFASPLLRA